MITHNGSAVNRKACWKCILNKLNHQQSVPAASPHRAAHIKALSRAPPLLQVLMRNSSSRFELLLIYKKWQWLQKKFPGRPPPWSWTVSLDHSCFYCGGFSWNLFLRGFRKGPLQGSVTLSTASVSSESLFYFDCSVIRTSCIKLCFLCVFSVLFSFVYVYKRTD